MEGIIKNRNASRNDFTLAKPMQNTLFGIILFLSSNILHAQTMRPIEELINTKDPGWPIVQQWIASAKNKVEVLPCDTAKAKEALYHTQVTTRSPMGAVVSATGGVMVDDGWIRILGSGSPRLPRTLPGWNQGKSNRKPILVEEQYSYTLDMRKQIGIK
jgi:hypothetical protein